MNAFDFIVQTAKDYDMTYDEVKKIYELHPDKLYDILEEFIETRRNKNHNREK